MGQLRGRFALVLQSSPAITDLIVATRTAAGLRRAVIDHSLKSISLGAERQGITSVERTACGDCSDTTSTIASTSRSVSPTPCFSRSGHDFRFCRPRPKVSLAPLDNFREAFTLRFVVVIPDRPFHVAGWSSPVAREAHNLEVVGSNPAPATFITL